MPGLRAPPRVRPLLGPARPRAAHAVGGRYRATRGQLSRRLRSSNSGVAVLVGGSGSVAVLVGSSSSSVVVLVGSSSGSSGSTSREGSPRRAAA